MSHIKKYLALGFFFVLSQPIFAAGGFVKANDINIYYELHGKSTKPPVILIAGFSCDHSFWQGVLKSLSEKHRVLVFDNRGVGRTSSPDQRYTVLQMADDVMALSNKLGLIKPVIIGQSMGSAIAQNIGKRYQQQIKKLVLINTFAQLGKAQEVAFELTGELQRLKLPMRYPVQSIAPWVYSSHFLSKPNQLKNLVKFAANNPYPQSLIGYERQLDALKSFDSRSWLGDIKAPVLIIAGKEDIIAPLAGAKVVLNGIGHQARLMVVPGGHASPIEEPMVIVKAISDFIDK